MKVCANCGIEIDGKDGENMCDQCDQAESKKKMVYLRRKNGRKIIDKMLKDMGMTRVKGALGGVYWE